MGAPRIVVGAVGVRVPGGRSELFGTGEIRGDTVDHKLFGAIGVDGANHPATWVIVHRHLASEVLFLWRRIVPARREKRFVLHDHPALVVVDLPATHHHARWVSWGALLPDGVASWE